MSYDPSDRTHAYVHVLIDEVRYPLKIESKGFMKKKIHLVEFSKIFNRRRKIHRSDSNGKTDDAIRASEETATITFQTQLCFRNVSICLDNARQFRK